MKFNNFIKHLMYNKPTKIEVEYASKLLLGKNTSKVLENGASDNILVIGQFHDIARSFLYPNLLNLDGNFLVTDTKGEHYEKMKNPLKEKGYNVVRISYHEKGMGFNPFSFETFDTVESIENFYNNLFSYSYDDPFWYEMQKKIFAIAVQKMVKESLLGKLDWSFKKIQENITNMENESIDGVLFDEKIFTASKVSLCVELDMYVALENNDFFRKSFDLSLLTNNKQKIAIFVDFSPTNDTYHRLSQFVISTICELQMKNEDRRKKDLFVFYNEFYYTHPKNMEQLMFLSKHHKIHNYVFVSTITHLRRFDKSNIMDAFIDTILFLGCTEFETCEYLSNLIGFQFVREYELRKVPLFSPKDLMYLAGDQCVIIQKCVSAKQDDKLSYKL